MDNFTILGKKWLLALSLSGVFFANAQELKVNLAESKLVVDGTSNLHDWTIDAKSMGGKATFSIESGDLQEIKNLDFVVEAEKLVSGKSGMDKNTFKALKTSVNKKIIFKLIKVNKITAQAKNVYLVETQGDLTVAGATKRINQSFTIRLQGKKIIFYGKQKIDMTLYGVEPPTALMGTIKTGKDVVVDFKVTYN
ncbi:YceI family protein [Flavobacterium sp.]|jgi:polyisoprenoid-binding protein YceI|uniref:YceI family protein n=1 Tax=Flavobacterium sp. TaxID=239 RepID=UPI0037BFA665